MTLIQILGPQESHHSNDILILLTNWDEENLTTNANARLLCVFNKKVLALGLFAGLISSSAAAQNYMYNQAALETGNKPSAVAIADFNGDGRPDVAVTNQTDNTVSIMLTKPDGFFASKVDYPVGGAPLQLVSADFNSDGKMDLAVVNSTDNTVSILLGVGDGTFLPQVTYKTGAMPVAITAADFNGDKHVDLAVANQSDSTITIFNGNGDGTFVAQSPVIAVATAPFLIFSADMNGDGKPEIIFLSGTANVSATLFLLTNQGNGTFSSPIGLNSDAIGSIAIGDVNGDGNLDIAMTLDNPAFVGRFEVKSVLILLGSGNGTFPKSISVDVNTTVGTSPGDIVLGDFNHDGFADLVVYEDIFLGIYLSNGDGTFQPPLLCGIPPTLTPPAMLTGDFNNDGLLDLVAVVQDATVALVLLGNGDGTLTNNTNIALPSSGAISGSVVADLNGDGTQDLAIIQFNQPQQGPIQGFIDSLLGNGDGTFQGIVSSTLSDIGINGTVSADFNGDGKVDIATADVDADGGLVVFLGNGNGTFGSPISSYVGLTGLNLGQMVPGDFNEDGKSDIIVVSQGTNNPMYALLSQGNGKFTENFLFNLAAGVPSFATGDFNKDGHLDFVAVSANQVLVFLGHGDGSFASPTIYNLNFAVANGVSTGDFNGDGKLDFVVGTGGNLLFFAGAGDGTFLPPVSTTNLLLNTYLSSGDFNGDGVLDLLTPQAIVLGNGDGTFRAPSPFQGTYGLSVDGNSHGMGDFNSDGTLDLVVFSSFPPFTVAPQLASILLSTPTPNFTTSNLQFGPQTIGASSSPQTISLSNAGNAPLKVASIETTGDFSQTNTCPNTLAIGQACEITVIFTPSATGIRRGGLTLIDNAKPGTQTIALAGSVVSTGPEDFKVAATPVSNSVTAGTTANYVITLTPINGFAGPIQVSCTGAPSKSSCSLTPSSISLNGSDATTVAVSVTTTAASAVPLTRFVRPRLIPFVQAPSYFAYCLLFLCLCAAFVAKKQQRSWSLLAMTFFLTIAIAGCGSGSSGNTIIPGTPSGTYTLTISTTAGNLTHTSTVTLIVN